MNLPQLPATAVGTLGLIGLGISGPGAGGIIRGAANNIVLLRALPPALTPLIPPLLTNPFTAIGLGLFIAALGGPIQSLGGILGDTLGRLEAQNWGYVNPSKYAGVSIQPSDALNGQVVRGSVSSTGLTRILTGPVTTSVRVWSTGQTFSNTYVGPDVKELNNVATAYLISYPRVDNGEIWKIVLRVISSAGGSVRDFPLFDFNYSPQTATLNSASISLQSLSGTGAPVIGDYGSGITLSPLPQQPLSFDSSEAEAITVPRPAPTPAYAPVQAPTTIPDITTVPIPGTEEDGTGTNPRRPVIAPPVTPEKPTPFPPIIPKPDTGTIGDLGPDGKPKPKPTPQPPVTDVDTHFVDGKPITTGQPRTDLESVAKEVGRIENKVAMVMQAPIQSGNLLEDLTNLLSLAELLLSLLDATTPGGSYTLSSPCVLDESDQRIETEVSYNGGPILSRLESKINAVAELLQVHKDLAQPGCDGPVPSGNVTVTFTEVV